MLVMSDQAGVPSNLPLNQSTINRLADLAAQEAYMSVQANQNIGSFDCDYRRILREILLEQEIMRPLSDWLRVRVPPRPEQLNLLFSTDVPEITDVNWELLAALDHDTNFDALFANTCIARVVPVPPRSRYHRPKLPAQRIGIALWQVMNDDEVVDRLVDQLETVLGDLPSQVELLHTRHASVQAVAEAIAEFGHPAVLHIVGHGQSINGVTLVPTEGKARDASELQMLLEPIYALSGEGCLLGMVMDVCRGGGSAAVSQAPALRLVQSGVPFAFAPQRVLPADSAIPWARGFYRALAQGASLLEATSRARATAYDRQHPLDWSLQKLFLGHTDWIAQSFLLAHASKPAGSNTGELRQMLRPEAQRGLRALSAELLGLVEHLNGGGIVYNRTHHESLEEAADELCRQLALGHAPLEPREAYVLLCVLHISYVGWLDADSPPTNLEQAILSLQHAALQYDEDNSECSALGYLLSRFASCVPTVWPDVAATLGLMNGRLPSSVPNNDQSTSQTVRHGLIAALVRLAQRFDAGTHRLAEHSLTVRRTPEHDQWRHACARSAIVTADAVRLGFQVPNEAYAHIVRLVGCADAWADDARVFDTLAVAGMRNAIIDAVIHISANGPVLRKPNGNLSPAVHLRKDLLHALQSAAPRDLTNISDESTPTQYDMAPFACSGVGEILRLPFPTEAIQRRCRVTLYLFSLDDDYDLIDPVTIEAAADEHLALQVEQLGIEPGHKVLWRLEVHRGIGRGKALHEGIFWPIDGAIWTHCQQALNSTDRAQSLVHRILARASLLRAHSAWADALMTLIEGLNALKGEPPAVRLPLYIMTSGIYDRMIETLLDEGPVGRRIAQRVRRHNEALWQLTYSELDIFGKLPVQAKAEDVASILLQEANLV